jgi:methanogenic corrinoid protein MtbC1
VETGADIICMSALLTTTLFSMKDVVEELERRGLRDKFVVMIGGSPVSTNIKKQ